MFCDQCGHENRNDRKFCSECGAPLKDYTKERTDLIYPDDLHNEKNETLAFNKKMNNLNKAKYICFFVACVLIVLSFVIDSKLTSLIITCLIGSIVFIVLYFALSIIAHNISKKRNKNLDKTPKDEQK